MNKINMSSMIPGWTAPETYACYAMLALLLPVNATVVEVGCFLGRSANFFDAMLRRYGRDDINFHAIDDFDSIQSRMPGMPDLYMLAQGFAAQCGARYTQIVQADSVAAASMFEDERVDAVYIDAGHERHQVLADIRAWWPKLAPFGLMIGDDYWLDDIGVIVAVSEFAKDMGLCPTNCGRLWILRKEPEK